MKRLVFLAIFAAGCPEQVGQSCPAKTVSVGQFSLRFTGQHDAGECVANTDAGPVRLTLDAGGAPTATICYGAGPDGGPQLQLIVPSKGARASDLLDDGGFHFTGSSAAVVGTLCGGACPVAIDETFDGHLLTFDGGFAVQPDGGLPEVRSVTGLLIDNLTTTDPANCVCALPCPVAYAVTGTR